MKKKLKPTEPEHIIKVSYDAKKKLAIASTDAVDRHGEIIDQDGWDLKNFKNNPVMLWAHDNYEPAVGYADNLQIVQMGDRKALTFTPVFHGKTELSAAIDALYNGDPETNMKPVLNSFSVGFRPTEQEGNVFTKQELLEISCVNVPANADARVLAYKGLVSKGISDRVAKDVINIKGAVQDELDLEAMWEQKRELMGDVRDIYWAFCDVFFDENTAVDDFPTLLKEVASLFSQVADGTYSSPVQDDDTDEVVTESSKVLDRVKNPSKTIEDLQSLAKGNIPSAPTTKVLSKRQTLAKAITRAADLLSEGNRTNTLSADQNQQLVKIIKRAGDKITASQKEELRNG
jgi:hypothetical protein